MYILVYTYVHLYIYVVYIDTYISQTLLLQPLGFVQVSGSGICLGFADENVDADWWTL